MKTKARISREFGKLSRQFIGSFAGNDLILAARLEKAIRSVKPEIVLNCRELGWVRSSLRENYLKNLDRLIKPREDRVICLMNNFVNGEINEEEAGENFTDIGESLREIIICEELRYLRKMHDAELAFMTRTEEMEKTLEPNVVEALFLSLVPPEIN